jgi:hypothetical protein
MLAEPEGTPEKIGAVTAALEGLDAAKQGAIRARA